MSRQRIRTEKNKVIENDSYYWVVNAYPKFEGHTLIVPKRHITKIGEETEKEILDREKLISYGVAVLRKAFPRSGVELFLQYGEGSQASIAHLHWHLVPASLDDPLRSFDKLGQFYTVESGKEKVILFPIQIKKSPAQLLVTLKKHVHTHMTLPRLKSIDRTHPVDNP